MPTDTSSALERMVLPEAEADPQPGSCLNLIGRARSNGQENWQTVHMGRFTQRQMHEPGPALHEVAHEGHRIQTIAQKGYVRA